METLEPVGVTDQSVLHPNLKGPLTCAQYDPITRDLFNYNLDSGHGLHTPLQNINQGIQDRYSGSYLRSGNG
ncbi:uncharacterized protein ATNIH1004_010523 [Aspergillus tanneri]|uniref:Uncharacterized protein n=1 Tax=Aspergillus tanneri TaxID=1220188 RepID=A0A5M9MGZ2_9EURO|nr:uncharacterized protein ATNIH1004_010523 [Aspergillus tanneri]KAA8643749.1 hypothetical protein ATNIH1004_010523 [Aspergillus tanneri]